MNTNKPPILFHSKADTLSYLQSYTDLAIPDFFVCTFAQWQEFPQQILKKCSAYTPHHVVVRSSCLREDSEESSGAGAFTSLLHIIPDNTEDLLNAINTVFASYGQGNQGGHAMPDDQVIIQKMLEDVDISGVIMTRVPSDGSPYYVINYDDVSRTTDKITGGRESGKTVYIYREVRRSDFDSERLYAYVTFCQRIESLCKKDNLDIEFCQDSQGIIHLLQVRPICTQGHWISNADDHVRTNINFINDFIEMRMHPSPGLYGSRTMLGVMPDWNPAEMIGITPRNLASSLYRKLITKKTWRQARALMGYRELPSTELMVLIGGRPFIDVRASFNSFLPQSIERITGEKLVNAWLDRLDQHPEFHDKVEFEIAQTIHDFCFEEHFNTHYAGHLSSQEKQSYKTQLQELTANCLNLDSQGTLSQAFNSIEKLKKIQSRKIGLLETFNPSSKKLLPEIAIFLEECRQYGTLAFSIIARHAFIAETLLKTAVKRGALEKSRLALLKNSIETVAGELSKAFTAVCNGSIPEKYFMKEYGHLRPGTYDILSPRYADREGLFSEKTVHQAQEILPFVFTAQETHALNLLLAEAGLGKVSVEQFEKYVRLSIAGRENAKFVFTRHLSETLEYLALWGESIELSREDLSFISIENCLAGISQTVLKQPKELFSELSDSGKKLFDLSRSLKLSYLIRSDRDVYIAPQHRSAPNFVGNKKIDAPVVCLSSESAYDIDMNNSIVCIENADPGFDWIFTRNIAGLVTMFGGMNSHMAIRCAEYGLPAAIGVGERLFTQISNANSCILDAETSSIITR